MTGVNRLMHVSMHRCLSIISLLLIGLASVLVSLNGMAGVDYRYDKAGRLIQVVNDEGQVARYDYDPAGNITSIRRINAGQLHITSFSPLSGPVGSKVTVIGRGFAAAAAGANTVHIDGHQATVVSAVPDKLVVTVPAGAATGLISVAVNGQQAQSDSNFIVTDYAVNSAPQITGFSPMIGAEGTAVNILGRNFDPESNRNAVRFGGQGYATILQNTASAISVTVPSNAVSGKIQVSTPFGIAFSNEDFIVPPVNYTVTPPVDYTAAQIGASGRVDLGVSQVSVTNSEAGKVGVYLFDGEIGQNLSIALSGLAFSQTGGVVSISVLDPSGAAIAKCSNIAAPGGKCPLFGVGQGRITPLARSGTYSIVLSAGGSYQFSGLLSIHQDVAGTLLVNNPMQIINIPNVGQNARYSFAGIAGQKYSLVWEYTTFGDATFSHIKVVQPGGAILSESQFRGGAGTLDVKSLPVTGVYDVVVIPPATASGQIKLGVTQELSGVLNLGGEPTTINLLAGQNGSYMFAGTAGQGVGVGIGGASTLPSGGEIGTTIFDPNGLAISRCSDNWLKVNTAASLNRAASCDMILPATGTYQIYVDPVGVPSSSLTLTVSPDVLGSLTPNGALQVFNTVRAGQNARFTFSGVAGQSYSVLWSGATFAGDSSTISVYHPDGTQVATTTFSNTSQKASGTLNVTNLPATGIYSVLVSPYQVSTGQVSIGVRQDDSGTLNLDGVSTAISLLSGQNGSYMFSGIAGQGVGLAVSGALTNPAGGQINFSIYGPDGVVLGSCEYVAVTAASASCDALLPLTGNYRVYVNPIGIAAATLTLTASSDLLGALNLNAAAQTITFNRAGQNARYTFSGTAGQNYSLAWLAASFQGTGTWCYLYVYRPNGSQQTAVYFGPSYPNGTLSLNNLPVTGTYTLLVSPHEAKTGQIGIRLTQP